MINYNYNRLNNTINGVLENLEFEIDSNRTICIKEQNEISFQIFINMCEPLTKQNLLNRSRFYPKQNPFFTHQKQQKFFLKLHPILENYDSFKNLYIKFFGI